MTLDEAEGQAELLDLDAYPGPSRVDQSPTRITWDDDGSLPLEQPPSFVTPVQTVLRLPWNEASVRS